MGESNPTPEPTPGHMGSNAEPFGGLGNSRAGRRGLGEGPVGRGLSEPEEAAPARFPERPCSVSQQLSGQAGLQQAERGFSF